MDGQRIVFAGDAVFRKKNNRETGYGILGKRQTRGVAGRHWQPLLERANFERLPAATAFNCGLCLYRLEEHEKALSCLKRAELLLGTPPDLDIREKESFFRAVEADGVVYIIPQ